MQIHIISMEPTEKNKLSNQEFPSLPFCLCVSVNGVCVCRCVAVEGGAFPPFYNFYI